MTAPLTPANCDIRDFPFMPLEVQRLRRSKAWLICKRDPSLAFHMMNLWSAAWHEVPAASLEDDDDVLADLAMCEPKRWLKIREVVLRGWVKCTDGRLYHPIVAEKAMTAWESKTAQRQRTSAAREARAQKRSNDTTDAVASSVTEIATDNVTTSVTNTVTASKGEGEGEGYTSSLRSDGGKPPKRPKPKTQIKPEWEPDEAGIAYANDRGVRIDQEVPAFRNRHIAKGEAMADWAAAWRTWCDNQVKWGRAPGKALSATVAPLFASVPASAPDPWGVRSWTSRQSNVGTGTDPRTGVKQPAINGYIVEQSAEAIAEAAGLPETWRGNWDALGAWLRDDVGLTDPVLSAVRSQANRMRSQGQSIGAIGVFDAAVRSAIGRAA